MQGAHPQQQQQQLYPMTSPELWGGAQQQHAAQGSGAYGGGAPQLLHGGVGMPALPSFELGPSAGGGQQPLVLSGKPLPASAPFFPQQHGGQGGMAGAGITGVPSSLTSLPGLPYSSTPSPPPGTGVPPQLCGGSPALAQQPGGGPGALPMGGHSSGGFPQLSDLSSQLSSGMALAPGAGLAPPLAPQLVPNPHLGGLQGVHGQGVPLPLPINTRSLVKLDPEEHANPSSSHSGALADSVLLSQCGPAAPQRLAGPPARWTPPAGCTEGVPTPASLLFTQHPPSCPPPPPTTHTHTHTLAAAMELPLRLPGSPASEDDGEGDGSPTDCMGSGGLNKSRYRGVSYDRKKAKWRVQIKVGSGAAGAQALVRRCCGSGQCAAASCRLPNRSYPPPPQWAGGGPGQERRVGGLL
jgi:hypothetical protein